MFLDRSDRQRRGLYVTPQAGFACGSQTVVKLLM